MVYRGIANSLLLLSVTDYCQCMQMSSAADELFIRYGICLSDSQQLFIGDVLLFLSVSRLLNFQHRPKWLKPQHRLMDMNKYNSSDLVELLQKSAVEQLTTYRQFEARYFCPSVTIVTTDFEALYAYKHGDCQRCLQLSTKNVRTLLYASDFPGVLMLPKFIIQLLDDDIVSLTALMLMVNTECRDGDANNIVFGQMSLSLYLMTQCQLKVHHSVTSLSQTFDYIKVAQRRHPAARTLDQLILKLIERKVVVYVSTLLYKSPEDR